MTLPHWVTAAEHRAAVVEVVTGARRAHVAQGSSCRGRLPRERSSRSALGAVLRSSTGRTAQRDVGGAVPAWCQALGQASGPGGVGTQAAARAASVARAGRRSPGRGSERARAGAVNGAGEGRCERAVQPVGGEVAAQAGLDPVRDAPQRGGHRRGDRRVAVVRGAAQQARAGGPVGGVVEQRQRGRGRPVARAAPGTLRRRRRAGGRARVRPRLSTARRKSAALDSPCDVEGWLRHADGRGQGGGGGAVQAVGGERVGERGGVDLGSRSGHAQIVFSEPAGSASTCGRKVRREAPTAGRIQRPPRGPPWRPA